MVATPLLRGSGSSAPDAAERPAPDALLDGSACAWAPLLLLLAPLDDEANVQSALYSLRAMEIMCAAITFETPG